MNTWLKVATCAVAGFLIFGAGYKYAAALYEADIANLQAQYALAMKEKTDEYRAKEQSQAKQLADAWDALERARAESVDLRDDVERVRNQAAALERKLSKRAPLPVHLKESCLPDVQACSQEAQAWLSDVKKWLETAQRSTTQ